MGVHAPEKESDCANHVQAKSAHYKTLVKQLVKHALIPASAQDAKDVETCVAGKHAL